MAGLPGDHAEDAVRLRLDHVAADAVEQRQRRLRVLARLLVALPLEIDGGVVEETEPFEIGVARPGGDLVAPREVAVRFGEQPPLRAHYAEVVVRDGAAVLVVAPLVRLEGARVAGQRIVEVALDVGDDPEVLFDSCAQLEARPPQAHGAQELAARAIERAGLEVDSSQRIQGLGGEHVAAGPARHREAALGQPTSLHGVTAAVLHHGEPAQRFGQHRPVPRRPTRGADRRLVGRDRLRNAPGAFQGARVDEQVRRGARGAGRRAPARARPGGGDDRDGGHTDVTTLAFIDQDSRASESGCPAVATRPPDRRRSRRSPGPSWPDRAPRTPDAPATPPACRSPRDTPAGGTWRAPRGPPAAPPGNPPRGPAGTRDRAGQRPRAAAARAR